MSTDRESDLQACGHPRAAIRMDFCAACLAVKHGCCPCARCIDRLCHVCGDRINLATQNWVSRHRPSARGSVTLHAGCIPTHDQREANHAN